MFTSLQIFEAKASHQCVRIYIILHNLLIIFYSHGLKVCKIVIRIRTFSNESFVQFWARSTT